MANDCLEFDKIVTKAGQVTPCISTSGCPRVLLYTVPVGHVAKISQAKNMGSGLMYGVDSAAGIPTGSWFGVSIAGQGKPSRHRDLSGTWMSALDKLYAYDFYDMDNSVATSHPDGFYAVIIEYKVCVNCC